MTQATKILREEHYWIRLLLECLDELLTIFRANGTFDARSATELQLLFEHFVDQQHQEKEEVGLFPKLFERLQRLQEEHAKEREYLDRMRFSLFNAALGDPTGRVEFAREANAYLDLQRRHMARENLGLLPLAEHLLTEEDDAEVLEEFRRQEAGRIPRDEVLERVRQLCAKVGVPFE